MTAAAAAVVMAAVAEAVAAEAVAAEAAVPGTRGVLETLRLAA
ncbi:MAG: hypothetical protein HLUCCO18_16580 [Rhodobacteraceae bacterium HLUCCO18]|nr:MAG: hypothetical protein HLUCCO18_16580 [Rhodobacteraceae bacterium HLUCCO18]